MPTVGSLQIKIGADVQAAINGLSRAEYASDRVAKAFETSSAKSVEFGYKLAGWATNFGTIAKGIQSQLDDINLDALDNSGKTGVKTLQAIVSDGVRVTESITTASAAFSGMQQVAGVALTGIARIIPSIGTSLVALTGPIGIVVGALGAAAALIITNFDRIKTTVSSTESVMIAAQKAITDEKLKVDELIGTLTSEIKSRGEKEDAIKKLNKISIEHFGHLNAEKSTVDDIKKSYDLWSEAILNNAKAQAAKDKISELSKKQLDIQLAYNKALLDASGLKKLAESENKQQYGPNYGFAQGAYDKALGQAKGFSDQLKASNKEIDDLLALTKNIKITEFNSGGSDSGGSRKAETNAQKIEKIYTDALNKIKAREREFKDGFLTGTELDKAISQIFKGAYDNIANIDVKSPKLDVIATKLKELENIHPQVTIDIAKPDVEVFADTVDTLINDTFGKIGDIELRYKFIGDGQEKIKEQISAIESALRDAGQLNVDVDDPRIGDLLEKLALLRSQLDKPFDVDVSNIPQKLEAIGKKISEFASLTSSVGNVIFGLEQNQIDEQYNALDEYYNTKKQAIESEVGLESIKSKKLEQLEEEVTARKKQIKREEAQGNKRKAVFESIINTARAIAEALPNVALSIAVGAIGAAQTAVIASAPVPALAKGALVDGPTLVQVGEYPGAKSNPEFIAPVDKAKTYIYEAVTKAIDRLSSNTSVNNDIQKVAYQISISDNISQQLTKFVNSTVLATQHIDTIVKAQTDYTYSNISALTSIIESTKTTDSEYNNISKETETIIKRYTETTYSQNNEAAPIEIMLGTKIAGDDIYLAAQKAIYRKSRLG